MASKEMLDSVLSFFSDACGDSLVGNTKFVNCFRSLAGSELSDLADFNGTLGRLGISLDGSNVGKTKELYICSLQILMFEKEDTIYLSSERAVSVDKMMRGGNSELVSADVMIEKLNDVITEFSKLSDDEVQSAEVEDSEEEEEGSWGAWSGDSEEEEIVTEAEETEQEEKVEEVGEKVVEETKEEDKATKDSIRSYYYQFYKGVVDELSKRYTDLFSSGYEVTHPSGILTNEGLVGLSGNKKVIKKFNVSIKTMYKVLQRDLDFDVEEVRSNVNIADRVYDSYMSDRRLKYFPNKLLEYAYGRKSPSGDNKESLNTYENHSNAGNWSAYCKSEVTNSLMAVVGGSVVKYVYLNSKGDYFDDGIIDGVKDFLSYLQECLSLCMLMVDYKSTSKGYEEDIAAFKIRVCDPRGGIINKDLTQTFINDAFMGATGSVPFSFEPRVVPETCIIEYAHEFNHNSSQASPLFAYKAFLALKEQGIEPTWENMILGMFEDGTILKNGTRGVSLMSRLLHILDAGSRAGKGVMTMNFVASAVLSNKYPFYIDRKPDMGSLFASLSKDMFVVNGGGYGGQYDTYQQFSDLDSRLNKANVPDYVCELLGGRADWDTFGDIVYMRALKLVMGIILARGDGKLSDPNFGGEQGILLVVDEFKNFQESFSVIVEKLLSKVPPSTYTIDKGKIENGEKLKPYEKAKLIKDFSVSYNNSSMYAISYLNSLVEDLEFVSTKRDAGFNQKEIELSDIFVIGQSLDHGTMDFKLFRSLIDDSSSSGRYKSSGRNGISSTAFSTLSKLGVQSSSFPYSLVNFKTADAFFGRNMEDGRDVYLAQTVKGSKAYGRLDDKASNFAYMHTFTDKIREDIIGGNVQTNTQLANGCIYFKPFLVLNDAKEGDLYTEGLFSRCKGTEAGKVWVSKEEIIAENPNEDGSFLNEAVGFEGYLRLLGVPDYSERLRKSSDVANYVVQNCLGYNGTWFDFITDMRPEWLFTVKDIVDGAKGVKPALLQPESNKVISEFVRFNPALFGLGESDGEGEVISSDSASVNTFMNSNNEVYHDYSDVETQDCLIDEDMKEVFGDYKPLDEEVSQPVSGDEDFDVFSEFSTPVETKPVPNEELFKDSGAKQFEVEELLARLKNLGVDVNGFDTSAYYNSKPFSEESNLETGMLGDNVESYSMLSKVVTEDVISKFGGYKNIKSFKVVGGSIIVNGYYYSAKVNASSIKDLPYDVRKELNTGNLSKVYNYGVLLNMSSLRELEFDSQSFVFDYVSNDLGHGQNISVDLIFRDLKSLQVLKIGRYMFDRKNYMSQIMNNDVFYHPKLRTRLATSSENVLSNFSKSSWSFTKNMFNSNNHGGFIKTLGVMAGLSGAVVGGTTAGTIKGGRYVLRGITKLGSSFKDMLDDSKNF